MKKKNKFVKIFTIIVIIVSLIASFWTGFLVLFWPSWNIGQSQDNIPKSYTDTVWNDNLTDWVTTWDTVWNDNLKGWDTTWDTVLTWSATTWWNTILTGSK